MSFLRADYTFDASAGTITFGAAIEQDLILGVWNALDGVKLYDPHVADYGGTVASPVLTLTDVDTSSMSDSDPLLVFYGQTVGIAEQATLAALLAKIIAAPATEAKQDTGNGSLANIDGKLPLPVNGRVPVDPTVGGGGIATNAGATDATTTRTITASDSLDVVALQTLQGIDFALAGGKTTGDVVNALNSIEFATETTLEAVLAQLQATISVTQSGSWSVTVAPEKVASSNTPSILTSGGDVLASNAARKSWGITNLGTNPLFVRMATGASSTVFHFVLAAGQANDDGFGGSADDDIYTGVVSATGTSPRFVVREL